MLTERRIARSTTNRAAELDHPGLTRSPFRQIGSKTFRPKHLSCKTCEGKGCVGRCRFDPVN